MRFLIDCTIDDPAQGALEARADVHIEFDANKPRVEIDAVSVKYQRPGYSVRVGYDVGQLAEADAKRIAVEALKKLRRMQGES